MAFIGNKWEVLDDDCHTFPAAIRPKHVDKESGQLLSGVFMRKGPYEGKERDTEGVSVTLSDELTTEQTIIHICNSFKDVQGIGRLPVGDVRACGPAGPLNVVQNRQYHANITGLPKFGENVDIAEKTASNLKNLTQLLYTKLGGILINPLSALL